MTANRETVLDKWSESSLILYLTPLFPRRSAPPPSLLPQRTVQHNVRVAAKYYKRISGSRMCSLLGMSGPALERAIADMVAEGEIEAKIDRPKDVVRFGGRRTDENVLSEWAGDIGELLKVVETTWEGIQKEMMA